MSVYDIKDLKKGVNAQGGDFATPGITNLYNAGYLLEILKMFMDVWTQLQCIKILAVQLLCLGTFQLAHLNKQKKIWML